MSNVRQSPSYQLSKTPPKLSNKHVLLKNNTINKSSKKSGKSRNTTNNNSADNIHIHNHNHNKPLKVVHISNPMRFKATAAEFRALVQGLTGRDAVVIDDDNNNNYHHHHHHFSGTNQDVAAAEEENDDAHHHHHHHGCANNNNSSESSNDDDEKVLLHHHHHHHHHHHEEEVAEVKLSTCLGTSSSSSLDEMMSFDYYGEFKGDLVVMEDLRAFMGDDHIHY